MKLTDYVCSLTSSAITDRICDATERLWYSAPNVSEERAHALAEAAKRGVRVQVALDVREDNYRNGYGDIRALAILEKAGAEVYDAPHNLVSFLIADGIGYLLFPQSRIFAEEGQGMNAVRFGISARALLIAHFFPPQTADEIKALTDDLYTEAEDEAAAEREAAAAALGAPTPALPAPDPERVQEVEQALKRNPPLNPDLKRSLNVYTTKLQFVEIEFEGSNFAQIRIHLPPDALPIKDAEFRRRLETRLRLFDLTLSEEENEEAESVPPWLQPLQEIKDQLREIRRTYLTHIKSRKKTILQTKRKSEVVEKLNALQAKIDKVKEQLEALLMEAFLDARDDLKQRLIALLKESPPKRMIGMQGSLFERGLAWEADQILAKVQMPELHKLLDKLTLRWAFYDLTWEDFRNEDFIDELLNAKVIKKHSADELRQITSAYLARSHSSIYP